MQPTQLEFGISRKEAIAVLSRIRYGQDSQKQGLGVRGWVLGKKN